MHFGTFLYTMFKGQLVGTDEFSNRYYRGTGKPLQGRERRWVVFKGKAEASTIPSEWHAWLHHTAEAPLTEDAALARPWQKEHEPNQTGTVTAHFPRGYDLRGGHRAPATGDYEPWKPE